MGYYCRFKVRGRGRIEGGVFFGGAFYFGGIKFFEFIVLIRLMVFIYYFLIEISGGGLKSVGSLGDLFGGFLGCGGSCSFFFGCFCVLDVVV